MKLIELSPSIKVLDFNYGSLLVHKNKIVNPHTFKSAKAYELVNSSTDLNISPLINFDDIITERITNYLTLLVSSEEKKIIESFENTSYRNIIFEDNNLRFAAVNCEDYPKFLVVKQKTTKQKSFNLLFKNVPTSAQSKNKDYDSESLFDLDIGNLDSNASGEEIEIDDNLSYSSSNTTAGLNKVNTISFLGKYYPYFKITMEAYQKLKSPITLDEDFWKFRLDFCQEVIKSKKLSTTNIPGKDIFFSFPDWHCIRSYLYTFSKLSLYDFQISQSHPGGIDFKKAFQYFRLATMSSDGDSFFNSIFILFFTLVDSKLVEKQPGSCRKIVESVIFVTRCCLILCNKNISTLIEEKINNRFYSRLIKLHRSIRLFEHEVAKQVTCSFNWETITASIGLRSVHISIIQNTYNSIKSELLRIYEMFCNRYKKNISLHLDQFFSNLVKCEPQNSRIWKKFTLCFDIRTCEIKDYSNFANLLISFILLSTPYPQRSSFIACVSLSNIFFHSHFKYEKSYFLEIRLKYNRKSRDHFFNSIYLHRTASKLLAFWILVLKPSILNFAINKHLKKINKDSTDQPTSSSSSSCSSLIQNIPFEMSATLKYVISSSANFTSSKKIPIDYYKEILFAYFHPNSLSIQLPTSQKISLVMSNHSNKHLYGSHFIRQIMPLFGVYIMEQYPTAVMAACASHTLIQHGLGHTQYIASRYYSNDGIDQFLVSKRRFAEICFIWCMFFENTTYKIPVLDLKISAANEAEFLDEE